MADKTYTKGIYYKEIIGQYGAFFLSTINVDKFIEFLQENRDKDGKVKLKITRMHKPGKYGDTHTAYLNDHQKPDSQPSSKPEIEGTQDEDDLPF